MLDVLRSASMRTAGNIKNKSNVVNAKVADAKYEQAKLSGSRYVPPWWPKFGRTRTKFGEARSVLETNLVNVEGNLDEFGRCFASSVRPECMPRLPPVVQDTPWTQDLDSSSPSAQGLPLQIRLEVQLIGRLYGH